MCNIQQDVYLAYRYLLIKLLVISDVSEDSWKNIRFSEKDQKTSNPQNLAFWANLQHKLSWTVAKSGEKFYLLEISFVSLFLSEVVSEDLFFKIFSISKLLAIIGVVNFEFLSKTTNLI